MSIFSKFKPYAQNVQNTQNPQKRGEKGLFENIEYFEHREKNLKNHPLSSLTYKLVGDYKTEQDLFADLIKYPQCVPCPKNSWHWQTKERCYQKCRRIPKECIYYSVAFYRVQS